MLPKINEETSFTKINIPSNRSIGVHPWRVKEEKELLFAIEGMDDQFAIKKEIIKFLKKCCNNDVPHDTLTSTDLIKIALELRKLSKGDAIEYSYKCPKCSTKIEDEIKITKNSKIKEFDSSPLVLNDKLTITYKEPSFEMVDKLIAESEGSSVKYNYLFLANALESVTINGETFTEFSVKDAMEMIDDMTSEQFETILDGLLSRLSEVTLQRKLKCLKCKEEFEVDFGDMFDFLIL